jgi:hypothetical protein
LFSFAEILANKRDKSQFFLTEPVHLASKPAISGIFFEIFIYKFQYVKLFLTVWFASPKIVPRTPNSSPNPTGYSQHAKQGRGSVHRRFDSFCEV